MQANTRVNNIVKPKVKPIRPNIPIRPNTLQQIQCDFCGRQFTSSPTPSQDQVNSIGRTFRVCPSCKSKFQNHRCIMCNTSTEDPVTHQIIEWKGLCERCTQIVMSGATKLKIEQELGVDYDSTMEVIPERDKELSNEELQKMFSYGQNFLSSIKK